MEKNREKIKEPFEPEDTPKPPQIIEPNTERQRENPIEGKEEKKTNPGTQKVEKQKKPAW